MEIDQSSNQQMQAYRKYHILHNHRWTKTYNPHKVANGFGQHYATVRKKLAEAITTGSTSIDQYLSKIPRTENSLVLRETTSVEIEKVIQGLLAKTSFGHDKVSNTLLKSISTLISYPLEIIFSQLIYYLPRKDETCRNNTIIQRKGT